ncbi:MAG: molybdopterin-dependent oxidoreductase [Spirochaetota bacterium]
MAPSPLDKRKRFAQDLLRDISSPSAQPLAVLARANPDRPDGTSLLRTRIAIAEAAGQDVVPTCCFSCNMACEVLAFRDRASGKVVKIEGDPSSPATKGVACPKGLAAVDLLYNPARLKKPLRRMNGKDQEPEWKEIGWDEALDEIVSKVTVCRDTYGVQALAFLEGTRRGWSRVYSRLTNAYGVPNHGAAGWAQCLWPRLVDCKVTFGAQYSEACDFQRTECIIVWGTNPAATWPVIAADIMDARERGAQLIVVDPRLSETAARADLWLRLKPGTDTDLALGMLHVIIGEDLYDHGFVEQWTTGFDKLYDHVTGFDPETVEKITGVPAATIRLAARTYATTRPGCIFRCVSVDQTADSVQACRALSLLTAVTGNIDVPGGNVLVSSRGELSQNTHEFILADTVPQELQKLRRGYDEFPLLCGKLSPVPSAHMPTFWQTVVSGEPYPIKAVMIFGSNAALSYTNSSVIHKALAGLDFLAVCDLFLTETGKYADMVLPASSWLERDNVISSFQTALEHTVLQQRVCTIGDSRSDVDIISELARRLGIGGLFWDKVEDLYDYLLSPTGLSFRQAVRNRRLSSPLVYHTYRENGFRTPSGKVELHSSLLEGQGVAPLPPGSPPMVMDDDYPLRMSTGTRNIHFRHTENRQNPWLRAKCPDPMVYLHHAAAASLGIEEGDMVEVSTHAGLTIMKAGLDDSLEVDTVVAVTGWGGTGNINLTTGWERFAKGIGTVPMRGLGCSIRKVSHDS